MSDPIDDGGPAFPISETWLQGYNGISLRDYFAGQALAGLAASNAFWEHGFTAAKSAGMKIEDWAAGTCYQQADAMLRARSGK